MTRPPMSLKTLLNYLDSDRVATRLRRLAAIGAQPGGGITRLAYTSENRQAAQLVRQWMEAAELRVTETPVGNITGLLPGHTPHTRALASGSHIDTVIDGGAFDGAVGVIAAIEALDAIRRAGGTRRPLLAIAFAAEESARFPGGALFASRVFSGYPIDDALLTTPDSAGTTLAEALRTYAAVTPDPTCPDALAQARQMIARSVYPLEQIEAFVELHVEQGQMLEAARCPVGIVDTVVGTTRFSVEFVGEQAHSGTTMMDRRRDALAAAAEAVLLVEAICRSRREQVVGTVGSVTAWPGSINTVPGRARLLVDIRSADAAVLQATAVAIRQGIAEIAQWRQVTYTLTPLSEQEPLAFDPAIVAALLETSGHLQIDAVRLPSFASHDAAQFARGGCRSGMIFVPSSGGISHTPRERTAIQDIVQGIALLTATLYTLANRPSITERDTHCG